MSTFIPKTETFRFAWVQTATMTGDVTVESAEAMFDAWLDEVKDEARSAGFDAGLSAAADCF